MPVYCGAVCCDPWCSGRWIPKRQSQSSDSIGLRTDNEPSKRL